MGTLEIVGGVLMLLTSITIIILVLLQEPTKGGMSGLTGSESFYNKNQGRTMDAILSRATKYAAIVFILVTIFAYAADVYLQ